MTKRIVHLGPEAFPELPDRGVAWRQWLERHGLPKANDIPARSNIVCDDEANTVAVLRFVRTDSGKQIVSPDGEELLKEWVTVQLEAPALPFPPGYETKVQL